MNELVRRLDGWHRPMLWYAAAMAALTVVCVGGLIFDPRILTGVPIWLKPFKFSVSTLIYGVTWAWMTSLLVKGKRVAYWVSNVIVATLTIEMVVIVLQVIRGQTSHFNMTTPLNGALFATMGASIVVLWTGTLVLTVLVFRSPLADLASRWAIRLGAVISLAGLALGFLMTSPTKAQVQSMQDKNFQGIVGAHSVGVPDGGPGMPITGWSTTGGDLRIPHFVGMHALQVLPLLVLLLGVLATRFARLRPELVRTRLLVVAAAAYAGLTAVVTWQAERGQSLVHPDGLTLAALGVLAGGSLLAAVVILARQVGSATPTRAEVVVP